MRTAVRAALLGLLLSAFAPTPGHGAPAVGDPAGNNAAANADFAVPDNGSFVIRGRGYGHGHGMSQYGAQGAARSGVGWKKILAFYYPGTKRATQKSRVRILISADTGSDVVVEPRSGLRVRSIKGKNTRILPARVDGAAPRRWRLTVDGQGRTVVAYQAAGWHSWWRFQGEGQFRAGGQPIRLQLPGGASTRYRGRLAIAGAGRDTVNEVSLENYIKGVVPREVPATWHANAVRAQAVAARTYAAYEMRHPRAGHYQLCDTSSCQVYGGYDAEHPASNAAVKATRRVVLHHQGAPAFTQFGSSSGGWTSANQFSYLPAQKDPYDDWAGNPVHSWQVEVNRARLQSAWPAIGRLRTIKVPQRDGNGDWGGRARSVVLVGSKGKVTVTGDTFRYALGLRSTWFTFRAN
ncbi:SpoIID/LytB domain-containing protein [Nocardioides daejeonensis]|uniref:SpoIID/LytB domain-containing protein n=1 Tax=Nocardioides daejeonensis TaxID=1046556 RepID=UPI000D746700|nr:SpoIID/LytB domain-containing protein [Nocardioides daejeonensis]